MTKNKKAVSTDKNLVPAVEQAMRVLLCIAQSDSGHMNLTQICAETGIHKSTTFCLLYTLRKYGIVQTEGRRKGYTLGPGLIGLSRKFLDTLSAPRLAEPILAELSGKTGVATALGLIADNKVFVAAKHEGGNALGITMRVGHRFPLTYGCHGKAICAYLTEQELNVLLKEEKLYFYGDPSKFDRQKLLKEIAECQRDGFAVDLGETVPGLNVIAAPVLGPNQRPFGYIAAVGLASAKVARQYGPLATEAAKTLSRQLGAEF
ncbi:IclR family transcriptional regulator [Desulfosarcina ovata subsp. sediminis]|uniref:IclR family transcriptional regulator n=1 Tax=Desulfosarcina ovata subsp. sediminis TaxID=885957 RepID=A0A5K7ZQM6_9BACT|nr:IclR family transcriptional regulator [Desulfosarcina ovata]BBO82070.1 IclR family transcriptional regulator [Desulfosarcina ovata subsp. sediminis]